MKSRGLRWKLPAVVVASALVLTGCAGGGTTPEPSSTSSEPRWGGALVVSLSDDVSIFNDNYDAESRFPYVAPNIFSRLINYDFPTTTFHGDLATEWEVDDEGKTYTFSLRDDVLWHDGEKFDAADVVFTYSSILEHGADATTYSLYKNIESVTAPDDHTVVFVLKEPSSVFLAQLTDYYGAWILPEHLFGTADPREAAANQAPVGTGPFKFVEKVTGDHVTLERNPDYFGQVPYVDKLVFRTIPNRSTAIAALKAGEIHFSTASPGFAEIDGLESSPQLNVEITPSEIFQWINFNVQRPIVSDPNVRKAIAMAIDTTQLNEIVYFGKAVPGSTIFRHGHWAADPKITQPKQDIEESKRLLDAAGYPVKADGTRFTLNYTTWNTSIFGGPELAQIVKQQLKEVGIGVDIEQNEFSMFNERVRVNHDFDMNASGGLHGPDPDAWSTFFLSTSSRNDGQFMNPQLDDLLNQGRTVQGEEARKEVYSKVQQVLADELPRINLVEYVDARTTSKKTHDYWWEKGATQSKIGQDMYNTVWMDSGQTSAPEGIKG